MATEAEPGRSGGGAEPDAPRFVHVPWIAGHGDWLIDRIAGTGAVTFAPLRLFPDGDDTARRDLLSFAELRPDALARAVAGRLARLRGVVNGLVLTHDWPAPMRVLARAAKAAGLPTVLVPHEAVFLSRSRYYRDARGPQVAPCCDHMLVWGGLQRGVFIERGAPAERIEVVGSPKLDAAAAHVPQLGPGAVRAALGVAPNRPFAVFALQLLDNAVDPAAARRAQIAAVRTVAQAAACAGAALVVRAPPSGARAELGLDALRGAPCLLDHGRGPGPLDVAAHAALVVSVGSTLLIEAYLMGRPTLQLDYDPAASGAELTLAPAAARDPAAAATLVPALMRAGFAPDPAFRAFLDAAFSPGTTGDGGAAGRIAERMRRLAAPAIPASGLGPRLARDPLWVFQRLRSLGASRRLAARLA